MRSVGKLPRHIQRLTDTFRDELNAEVDVERGEGARRYRIAVLSERFKSESLWGRQKLLWPIVDRVLTQEQARDVSVLLAFTSEELDVSVPETTGD